ncbi:NAD+-dependent protein deacetylase SIR2 [Enteropsectra breve]|nr:NAD+-dependent protein deacetylase SIR2 [Enteropsectra breve]
MIHIDDAFLINNKHILKHKKCVFVVGAGISVPSGIPDFRSPTGIFSSLRSKLKINGKDLFTYNFGLKEGSREIYLKYIAELKELCDAAQPNTVHRFLSEYPRARVYTQNIDCLEAKAGMKMTKDATTRGVYLHGNLALLNCQYCGFKMPFLQEQIDLYSSAQEMECPSCVERRISNEKNNIRKRPIGNMHPGIIHYQQAHPEGAFIGRMAEKDKDLDLLIVIGTSLKVDGVKKMVKMFSKCPGAYGKRILVNMTKPTKEWEEVFDYFYEGDCVDFVDAVLNGTVKNNTIMEDILKDVISEVENDAKSIVKKVDTKIKKVDTKSAIKNDRGCDINTVISRNMKISLSEKDDKNNIKGAEDIVAKYNSVNYIIQRYLDDEDSDITKCSESTTENNSSMILNSNPLEELKEEVNQSLRKISLNSSVIEDKRSFESVRKEESSLIKKESIVIDNISRNNSSADIINNAYNNNNAAIKEDKKKNSSISGIKDSALLMGPKSAEKPKIYAKVEALSSAFDEESSISQPVLDEILKESESTAIGDEELDKDSFINEQKDSTCVTLEDEFTNIIKEVVTDAEKKKKKKCTRKTYRRR